MRATVADAAARRLLEERTRRLARPRHGGSVVEQLEVVVCELGESAVAFAAASVREVLPPGPAARLPGGGHLLVGIRNVRGDVLAVGDLGRLLDPTRPAASASGPVVVLSGAAPLGLAVDGLRGVAVFPADEVAPPSEGGASLVIGIAPDGVALLDGVAVLDDVRLRTTTAGTDRVGAAPANGHGGDGPGR